MLEKVMQKTWKMTPTWRQNGGRNPSKNMKKQYKKTSRKMMQKLSAKKLWARRGDGPGKRALGPGVPEEVRSSSGDSRSRFPLASNILQKTTTRQTTKKQPRNPNPTRTHLACRQARCGSIHILGPWSPGVFAHAAPLHGRSQLHFSVHFSCRLYVIVFRVLSGFRAPFVVVLG